MYIHTCTDQQGWVLQTAGRVNIESVKTDRDCFLTGDAINQ